MSNYQEGSGAYGEGAPGSGVPQQDPSASGGATGFPSNQQGGTSQFDTSQQFGTGGGQQNWQQPPQNWQGQGHQSQGLFRWSQSPGAQDVQDNRVLGARGRVHRAADRRRGHRPRRRRPELRSPRRLEVRHLALDRLHPQPRAHQVRRPRTRSQKRSRRPALSPFVTGPPRHHGCAGAVFPCRAHPLPTSAVGVVQRLGHSNVGPSAASRTWLSPPLRSQPHRLSQDVQSGFHHRVTLRRGVTRG
jgi:hypothetical protein